MEQRFRSLLFEPNKEGEGTPEGHIIIKDIHEGIPVSGWDGIERVLNTDALGRTPTNTDSVDPFIKDLIQNAKEKLSGYSGRWDTGEYLHIEAPRTLFNLKLRKHPSPFDSRFSEHFGIQRLNYEDSYSISYMGNGKHEETLAKILGVERRLVAKEVIISPKEGSKLYGLNQSGAEIDFNLVAKSLQSLGPEFVTAKPAQNQTDSYVVTDPFTFPLTGSIVADQLTAVPEKYKAYNNTNEFFFLGITKDRLTVQLDLIGGLRRFYRFPGTKEIFDRWNIDEGKLRMPLNYGEEPPKLSFNVEDLFSHYSENYYLQGDELKSAMGNLSERIAGSLRKSEYTIKRR